MKILLNHYPNGSEVTIRTFDAHGIHDFGIEKVELLGHDGQLTYTRDDKGLHIQLPHDMGAEYPLGLRITLL